MFLEQLHRQDLRLELIWAYQARFSKDLRRSDKSVFPFRLWKVLEGQVEVGLVDRREIVSSGSWLIPGFNTLSHYIPAGTEILSVSLRTERRNFSFLAEAPFQVLSEKYDNSLSEIAGQLITFYQAAGGPVDQGTSISWEQLTLERFFDLQTQLSQLAKLLFTKVDLYPSIGSAAENPFVQKIYWQLQNLPLSTNLPRREIMEELSLSWRRVEQLISQHYFMTPSQIWETRKMRYVVEQMNCMNPSLKAISYELGFSNPSHFTRWFKKKFGQLPSIFLQQKKYLEFD